MDEALKARLIGAAVLVALAVLLIPELLSGRKPAQEEPATPAGTRGTRTFTIELAGGAPASTPVDAPAPTAQQAAPASAVVPAVQEPSTTSVPAQAVQAAPASRAVPEPAPASAAPAATQGPVQSIPARGGWAVQVGAFGTPAAAEKVVRDLQSAGYRTYVAPVSRSGKTLYRVRVGPEAERSRAEALAASLKGRGLPATVVANE